MQLITVLSPPRLTAYKPLSLHLSFSKNPGYPDQVALLKNMLNAGVTTFLNGLDLAIIFIPFLLHVHLVASVLLTSCSKTSLGNPFPLKREI
jgi:hypothetical protein